jgi:hypothetical protein
MTQPAQRDGRLFYLLALYAALDQAVMESGDPGIAATVEGFLPGTTGDNHQRGWSENLEQFLQLQEGFPDVNEALSALVEIPDLTASQLSRLVYVLGSLMHLPAGRVGIEQAKIVRGLSLARPAQAPGTEPTPTPAYATGAPSDPGSELFKVLQKYFNKQGDWHSATTYAASKGFLDKVVASIPPCGACLTTLGGIECVVVDTQFDDPSLTVGQVEAILDPRNWDKTSVLFFCKMKDLKRRKTPPYKDWGRVLETASGWCGVLPDLKTQLKFFKAEYPNGGVVQYDLDDSSPNQGDGKATVDRGWLKVVKGTTKNRNAGVTVSTRKVVHITGLWPVAQKEFVCVMGYGEAARDMLQRGAAQPPKNLVAWSADPKPLHNTQPMQALWIAPEADTQAMQPPEGDQAVHEAAESVASGSGAHPKTAAGLAVSMMSDNLAETANDSAKLAAKFGDSDLTVDDLVKFSAKLGARMASEPLRFLQKLAELPPDKPTGVPIKGDDGF